MAFIVGWKSEGGYFNGKVFSTAIEDFNQVGNWLTPPAPGNYLAVAGGNEEDMNWGEEVGLTWMHNSVRDLQQVMAIFPVQGTNTRREIVVKLAMSGDPGDVVRLASLTLWQRVYSDAEHYTDTQYGVDSTLDCNWEGSGNLTLTDRYSISVGFALYGQTTYFVVGAHRKETNVRYGTLEYADRLIIMTYTDFLTWIDNGEIPEEEFDPGFGPAAEEGGYGPGDPSGGGSGGPAPTFDDTSDPWVPSGMPPGISNLGFLNIYKCDANSLVNLGQNLFPEITWPTSLSDVGEVLAAVSDSIWNSKLIDFVISIHMIPVDVPAGSLEDIKLGARTMTGILARKVSDDYVEVNCGTLHIDEYYTSFADYMTKCRLFLPFYGFIDLKPEYWQSADLNVAYRFNIVDGTFVARVTSTVTRHQKRFQAQVGQYSGSACIHLPASGASYASIFSGVVSNAGGAAVGMATGNVAAAGTSIMNTAAAMGSGGEANYSNPYNASGSIMGHRVPYVLIERPVSHFSTRYATEKGIPLLVAKTIGSCRGFTTAEDAILDGIPATLDEKERIRQFLKTGVIIK